MKNIRDILIKKINASDWWHVPPSDPDAYKKRGKFLASTYLQAEFYGRPNLMPEQVRVSNPIFGFSEEEILIDLFSKNWEKLMLKEDDGYSNRIELDRKMYVAAKRKGYDAIVLLTPNAKSMLRKGRKPNSIELNLLYVK